MPQQDWSDVLDDISQQREEPEPQVPLEMPDFGTVKTYNERRNAILEWLRKENRDRVYSLLVESGVIERLTHSGLLHIPALEREARIKGADHEWGEILVAMRTAAKKGDVAAAKAYREFTEGDVADKTFNVDVRIEPYTVADPSLPKIISQADEKVQYQMLRAVVQRMKDDGATDRQVEDAVFFVKQWKEWADVTYAPKSKVA